MRIVAALLLLLACCYGTAGANNLFTRGAGCTGALFAEDNNDFGDPDGMCKTYSNNRASKFEAIPENAPFSALWNTTAHVNTRLFIFTATCNETWYFQLKKHVHGVDFPSTSDTSNIRYECDCAADTLTTYTNGVSGGPIPLGVCQAGPGGGIQASGIYTCSMCGGQPPPPPLSTTGLVSGGADVQQDDESCAAAVTVGTVVILGVALLCL